MSSNYGTWSISRLKNELSTRGAKVTGRKAELIERLEAYERNDDFRGQQTIFIPEATPMPNFPEISNFRTLTQSDVEALPKVLILNCRIIYFIIVVLSKLTVTFSVSFL